MHDDPTLTVPCLFDNITTEQRSPDIGLMDLVMQGGARISPKVVARSSKGAQARQTGKGPKGMLIVFSLFLPKSFLSNTIITSSIVSTFSGKGS